MKFICPAWGMDLSNTNSVIFKIMNGGYDGVEIGFPLKENEKQKETFRAAYQEGLILIAQHYDADGETPEEYLSSFSEHLYFLASLNPFLINSQTGKDYFSFEENCAILEKAFAIENETGVRILHETHRGKFSYSIDILEKYLNQFPQLRITADFSHYCAVSESFLQTARQKSFVEKAIARTDHIHARVGYPQGPQINDPQAEEWKEALQIHLQWWDAIIEKNKSKDIFTITPEFGPPPYMSQLPYSREPVSSQWEINLFMKELLNKRYTPIL